MPPKNSILQATRDYERWLASELRLVKADVLVKHQLMAADVFSFLRATFYRWIQLFPQLCPDLTKAPTVLAVGDLHVENFGTWRDAEGRLIWGVNDFDEAYPLPYTADLVRLAASAWLAIEAEQASFTPAATEASILAGYSEGLKIGGEPFVLSERHPGLREAVTSHGRDPVLFWAKLDALPSVRGVPAPVRRLLRSVLPEPGLAFRVAHRRAGLGSLGRQRFLAIAEWRGGKIAREAKAMLPSACVWAGGKADQEIYYGRLLAEAVRAADPFLQVRDRWIVRRLSPYCSRVELAQMPKDHDKAKLLRAMGRELANVHWGSPKAVGAVRRDLGKRKAGWLKQAAAIMVAATKQDWQEWRKSGG